MKGITKQLKDLAIGEQIILTDCERSAIHKIATRVGVRVKCEKFTAGFYVTRVGEAVAMSQVVPVADRIDKIADLQALISSIESGRSVEAPTVNEWIDAGEHWNEITGEMVAMQRHFKTGKYREKQ